VLSEVEVSPSTNEIPGSHLVCIFIRHYYFIALINFIGMILSRLVFFSVLLFCFSNEILGQDTIYLKNPSFEDIPRAGTGSTPPIKGWYDCGISRFPSETPPDIHPVSTPAWGVTTKPFDGQTYLGLVVRDNDSWESVSQELKTELIAEKCYSFSTFLCKSSPYQSRTKKSSDKLENFTTPAVFLIWGGTEFCDKSELLAESAPIDHAEWKNYSFEFWPSSDYKYITLEAFYKTPVPEAYNGHILIDNLSPIIEISCD